MSQRPWLLYKLEIIYHRGHYKLFPSFPCNTSILKPTPCIVSLLLPSCSCGRVAHIAEDYLDLFRLLLSMSASWQRTYRGTRYGTNKDISRRVGHRCCVNLKLQGDSCSCLPLKSSFLVLRVSCVVKVLDRDEENCVWQGTFLFMTSKYIRSGMI